MSNYTKTTDFAAKDTLPGGDTNKVVRGTEFETEFDAISTAIATKSDTASPTFTGTVTIPTVDINAGAIDGTAIGASSAAAGTFTNLTASGTVNFNGATISNLGTITTANLDGGTIDNAVIGGSTAAAGSFTTVAASSSITVGGAAVLTTVTFSNLDAGAVTTSGETFTDSDTQIPTNAAVKAHVAAVTPTLSVTESSVTAHQAALAIAASQLSDVTSTATELNLVDGSTADTVVNSKAVIYGSAGQITANELDVDNIQIDANAVKSTNTNGNIQLFPNGTGFTELYGNTNAGAIRFNCESNSHGVTLKGPPHSAAATYSLELPNSDGSAGQFLKTDGSGKLAFASVSAGTFTFLQKYEPGGSTDIIDIEAFDTSQYSAYMILIDNLIHASGGGDFRIYYKVDGSYRTDNKYSRRLIRTDQGGTGISTSDNSSSSQSFIDLGNEAEFTGLMHVFFTLSSNPVHDNTLLTFDINCQQAGGGSNTFAEGSATYYNSSLSSNRLQGLRIDGASNFTGTVSLYGIDKG